MFIVKWWKINNKFVIPSETELTTLLGYPDTQNAEIIKELLSRMNLCSCTMKKLIHYIVSEKVDIVDVSNLTTAIFTNSILKSCDD